MDLVATFMSAVVAAGGSAVVIGGLAAFLGKVWMDRIAQDQKDLAQKAAELRKQFADIDLDLRNARLAPYKTLWRLTGLCPRWPRDPDVSYEDLRAFSERLRRWYYEEGGMLLSESAREKAYGPLQQKITDVLGARRSGALSPGHYDEIQQVCSYMRTALTRDLESRREGLDEVLPR